LIKILIIDDHPIIRDGLRQIISDETDMEVKGEAETGRAGLDILAKNKIDLVLLDISLPDIPGIEVLYQIRNNFSDIPVLILSGLSEEQYGVRLLKAGASGYLHKESAPDDLVGAIRKVMKGNKFISASLAEKLLNGLSDEINILPHESLSDREFEVLCLLGRGISLSDIAENLSLSVQSISTYRSRLLKKMNFNSNAELIKYCVSHKLLG